MNDRGLASGSVAVLAGMVLRELGIIATFSVLSRSLDQSDYGLYRQAWMVGLAVTSITTLGLPQAMQYFIPQIRARRLRRRAFLQSLLLIQIGGCAAGLILYYLAGPLAYVFLGDAARGTFLRTYWPVVLFLGFWIRANQVFNSIERPVLAGVMTGAYGALLVGSMGAAVLATRRLEQLFVVQSAAMFAVMLPAALVGWRRAGEGLHAGEPLAPPGASAPGETPLSVGRQLIYSLPLTATFLVEAFNRLIDKALVSNRFNSAQFAEYANGAIEVPVGTILVGSVFSTMQPALTRANTSGNTPEAVRLNHLAVRNIALIVFPSAILLAILSTDLMVFLFGARYAPSGPVFLAYSIGMLAVLYSPYSLIISTGKTRLTFYLSLAASATNLGMSWAGITLFGMIGAAVGSTLYRFLINLLFARIAAGAMGTTFRRLLPWGHLGRTLLVGAAAGVPAGGLLFLPLPPVARLLAGTALYFGAYVLIGLKTRLIEDSHLRLIRHWLAGPRRG